MHLVWGPFPQFKIRFLNRGKRGILYGNFEELFDVIQWSHTKFY